MTTPTPPPATMSPEAQRKLLRSACSNALIIIEPLLFNGVPLTPLIEELRAALASVPAETPQVDTTLEQNLVDAVKCDYCTPAGYMLHHPRCPFSEENMNRRRESAFDAFALDAWQDLKEKIICGESFKEKMRPHFTALWDALSAHARTPIGMELGSEAFQEYVGAKLNELIAIVLDARKTLPHRHLEP